MANPNILNGEYKELPFSGKEFLVTGSSSGIGQAIAQEAFSHGAHVTGIDIMRPSEPASFSTVLGDITHRPRLDEIASGIAVGNRKIEYLVLAAGITEPSHSQDSGSYQRALDRVMDVNVNGTTNSYSAFIRTMSDTGTIVFVSSDTITDAQPAKPVYTTTKLHIAHTAQYLYLQSLPQRIITLLPGPVDTPLFREGKSEERIRAIDEKVGVMSPSQFAKTTLQILNDSAQYPSGTFIRMYKNKVEIVPYKEIINATNSDLKKEE